MDKKQIIEDYLQGRHPIGQQSWELPSAQELDNAEAEFDRISLTPRPLQRKRGLKFWPLAVAACVVGFVVIFLAPPKSTEEQLPLALEEPVVTEQPVVAEVVEQPVPEASDKSDKAEPTKPRKVYKPRKVSNPVEEPLLAEVPTEKVQPIRPEMEDPFLAIAEQMQDIRSRGEQVRQEVAQIIDNKDNLQ